MAFSNEHKQNTQTLQLAIAIERHCGQLYLDWAYRFRPYDLGTSIILKELAKEEVEHERELIGIYTEVTGKKAPTNLPKPVELAGLVQCLQSIQDHFFVINPAMAKIIIETALKIELFTHDFYQQYLKKVNNSQVAALIRQIIEFEGNHARILMERLTIYSPDFSLANKLTPRVEGFCRNGYGPMTTSGLQ